MKYSNILITGASGKLGKALAPILESRNMTIFAPTRQEMDITNLDSVQRYFSRHNIDAVIHCAALTDMKKCETSPKAAIEVNIGGTLHIATTIADQPQTRFIYLSTDYVYPCTNGPYGEEDPTIPFNTYAWTKLGGECAVKSLKNHCVIRTSFFNPENIPFDTAPKDAFCSKISFLEGAEAILFLLNNDFVGTINVGQDRISLYDLLKKYRKDMRPITLDEMNRETPIKRARDSSLNVTLWKKTRGVA